LGSFVFSQVHYYLSVFSPDYCYLLIFLVLHGGFSFTTLLPLFPTLIIPCHFHADTPLVRILSFYSSEATPNPHLQRQGWKWQGWDSKRDGNDTQTGPTAVCHHGDGDNDNDNDNDWDDNNDNDNWDNDNDDWDNDNDDRDNDNDNDQDNDWDDNDRDDNDRDDNDQDDNDQEDNDRDDEDGDHEDNDEDSEHGGQGQQRKRGQPG
jgi:hypothetical protein